MVRNNIDVNELKKKNLVTPQEFAEKLYFEQGVEVSTETIRNAIKDSMISIEGKFGKSYMIDYFKNKDFRPRKIGRPNRVY